MRILHLSDLHLPRVPKGVTKTSLAELWSGGIVGRLGEIRFDFIVVSGDLTQLAAPSEYDELLGFSRSILVPLLERPAEIERIVFVPGNHDVSWSADVFDFQSATSLDFRPDDYRAAVREFSAFRGKSSWRLARGELAHVELYRIKEERYSQRFAAVQRFIDVFYQDCEGVRKFELLAERGRDWSAHIFRAEGVAFYGFNSAWRNDRLWIGAAIDPEAIAQAGAHARKRAKGLLKVAVWHHGISSDEQREDYLRLADIGRLHSEGFTVGFHGHTHKAAFSTLDESLGGRFAVVATGSLGAAALDRPGAVGNQFSIIELFPSFLSVRTAQRDEQTSQYEFGRSRLVSLSSTPQQVAPTVLIDEHRRVYEIGKNGIARVSVALVGVDAESASEIVLATVMPPYCNVRADDKAAASTRQLPVTTSAVFERSSGAIVTRHAVTVGPYDRQLTWAYVCSNGFALDQNDLAMRDSPPDFPDDLEAQVEVRPHTVRIPCRTLVLRTEYVGAVMDTALAPRVLAQRLDDTAGGRRWVRDLDEEARIGAPKIVGSAIELSVAGPRIGYRYGAIHSVPPGLERRASAPHAILCRRVLDILRYDSEPEGTASASVAAMYRELLEEALTDTSDGDSTSLDARKLRWHAFLWSPIDRRLLTVYGRFPPAYWGIKFARGNGVAGHAFRFADVCVWHADVRDTEAVALYQADPDGGDARRNDHRWIVCVPILIEPNIPVGVVSFEATRCAESGLELFDEYARLPNQALSTTLVRRVNVAFWSACQAALPDAKDAIESIVAKLGLKLKQKTSV